MAIDFDRFGAITFDCYGTLIDWEAGILEAVRELCPSGEGLPPDGEILELFGRLEAHAERGPFRPYGEVLARVADGIADALGLALEPGSGARFAASVGRWPPFADSTDALRSLATRYRLAIVSNVDDDLFAASAARLGVDFDEVVTAQQVRSYKPAAAHFHEALRRLALPVEGVLHVAQSLYHDIAPAKELGFTCVWINRRADRAGGGATPAAVARPDLEVRTLAELVSRIEGA